jgi:hypothetical protein
VEAVYSPGTSIDFQRTTRRYISEDRTRSPYIDWLWLDYVDLILVIGKKLFLFETMYRPALATQSASHPRGPRGLFLDVKWPEHETHNSSPLNLVFKVKNMCADFSLRRRTTPL